MTSSNLYFFTFLFIDLRERRGREREKEGNVGLLFNLVLLLVYALTKIESATLVYQDSTLSN